MVEMLPAKQGISFPALIWDLRADLRRRFRSADPTLRSKWMAWLVTSGTKEYRALLDAEFMIHWLSRQAVNYPGLSPLQELIWHARPDVQKAYALPRDTAAYLGWFFFHGVGEHALWPWLTEAERRQSCLTEGPWQSALLQQASDAVGERIFRLMLETASGRATKSEQHGYGQNEFVPWQLGAVM